MFTTPLQQLLAFRESQRVTDTQQESVAEDPRQDAVPPASAADGITMLPLGPWGWPASGLASWAAGDDRSSTWWGRLRADWRARSNRNQKSHAV
jgi:hypothetical protein